MHVIEFITLRILMAGLFGFVLHFLLPKWVPFPPSQFFLFVLVSVFYIRVFPFSAGCRLVTCSCMRISTCVGGAVEFIGVGWADFPEIVYRLLF